MDLDRLNYPRPQLQRKAWIDLNGVWDFSFDDEMAGERLGWMRQFPCGRRITVPFSYETKMSGIGDERPHRCVWYHRILEITPECMEKQFLLHFEGVDHDAKVWVNGQLAGSHKGGYSRFSFEILSLLHAGRNDLTVRAEDSLSETQVRGKQRWKEESFECWYVQTTGIWKSVWAEPVESTYIRDLRLTPCLSGQSIEIECGLQDPDGRAKQIEALISFEGRTIRRQLLVVTQEGCRACLSVYDADTFVWGIRLWSPEDPALYDLCLRVLDEEGRQIDTVFSYFGMREIAVDGRNILLNGRPYYQKLILDQGYWEDSHLTPPSGEALLEDVEQIRRMGYNGLRKHQKTEDERFLYLCDVKGLLVWGEMPSFYRFCTESAASFLAEWTDVVLQNYNHPSVIVWTPLNESWGVPEILHDARQQSFAQAVYHTTKALDAMRPVIVNDGWEHTVSDIVTLHDYEANGEAFLKKYDIDAETLLSGYPNGFKKAFADGFYDTGKPVLISEYGGIAWLDHRSGWGYGDKVHGEEEFLQRFREITAAIQALPYCCGYCYTQLTDVQQEINGLLTADRKPKVASGKIAEINCGPHR